MSQPSQYQDWTATIEALECAAECIHKPWRTQGYWIRQKSGIQVIENFWLLRSPLAGNDAFKNVNFGYADGRLLDSCHVL